MLCLLLVAWLLVFCYSLTGCAASPPGKCNLAQHSGREGVPPGFHSPENRKDGKS